MEEMKLSPPWKQAVKELIDAGLTYGSTVTKDQIIDLCDMQRPTTIQEKKVFDLRLMGCIGEIKDALLIDHTMLLVTNRDESYRVISPKEQTAYSITTGARDVAKAMYRMALNVQYVNTALLDETQRKQNADAQAKISMLTGMNRTANSELRGIVGTA